MAYSRKALFEKAKETITARRCIFIEETCDLMGVAKSTFYKHIPDGSDYSNALKDLLQQNKSELKNNMRLKWYKSEAPALQLALYKLNATEEELRKLQMSAVEVSAVHKILTIDPLSTSDDSTDHSAPEISGT